MKKIILKVFKRLLAATLWFFNKTLYLKIRFYRSSGYWPIIKEPKTINENIFKLKINSPESYDIYADKLLVRSFIENRIIEHNLSKLRLPTILLESENVEHFLRNFRGEESFIKANHGSGMCFYFDGKTQKSLTTKQINLMKKWLRTDYYKFSGETCYKNIKRKVFAEQSLKCKDG
ncbi:MAG: hypothetical protein IBX55_23285, partial [Methyloprofundus sp.]|nr:hypothetical protein [Methyloprofundus sp.]